MQELSPEAMLTTAAHASPGEEIPGNSGNGQGVDLHALPAEQPLLSRDGNGSQASLLALPHSLHRLVALNGRETS